ncbi:unnamed protein product [Clavelina lepadiformis]|uniref:Uncharacterized protein n=1 Tax=Clavelina lepadiformis TaxID=159417 RepID=A0ABP0FMY0_CLALP
MTSYTDTLQRVSHSASTEIVAIGNRARRPWVCNSVTYTVRLLPGDFVSCNNVTVRLPQRFLVLFPVISVTCSTAISHRYFLSPLHGAAEQARAVKAIGMTNVIPTFRCW